MSGHRPLILRSGFVLFALVFAGLVVQNYSLRRRLAVEMASRRPVSGILKEGDSLEALRLIDGVGEVIRFASALGHQPSLVYIYSAQCPSCDRDRITWSKYFTVSGPKRVVFVGLDYPEKRYEIPGFGEDDLQFYGIVNDEAFRRKITHVPQLLEVDSVANITKVGMRVGDLLRKGVPSS